MKKKSVSVKVFQGIIAIPTKKEKRELKNAKEILKTGLEDHGERKPGKSPK